MQFGAKLVGKSPINQGWWEKSQLINHIATLHSVTTTSCRRAILLLFPVGNLEGLFFSQNEISAQDSWHLMYLSPCQFGLGAWLRDVDDEIDHKDKELEAPMRWPL